MLSSTEPPLKAPAISLVQKAIAVRPTQPPSFPRSLIAALAAVAAVLGLAAPAAAWNAVGHMATGALAYDVLQTDDPGVVRAVLSLVPVLPQQGPMDAAVKGLSGPARDRMIFEYLARWPDDIRGGPLDHPDWHYAVHIVSPSYGRKWVMAG